MRLLPLLSFALLTACTGEAPAPVDPEPPSPVVGVDPSADEGAKDAGTTDDDADDTDDTDGDDAAMDLPDAAKLEEAKGKVRAMMSKDDALKAVSEVLGEPTTNTDESLTWTGKDGDDCKALTVQLMADFTGNVTVEDADCPSGEAE